MTLKIEIEKSSLWARVEGQQEELRNVEAWIAAWSRGLSPKEDSRALCLRKSWGLKVLVGALMQAVQLGLLNIGEPAYVDDSADKLEAVGLLRSYQAEAVRRALGALLGRAVLEMAMASGKTRTSAALAACAGGNWLYVVTNMELALQAKAEIDEVLPELCAVTGKVATVSAMNYGGIKRLERKRFEGIIVDEAHGLPAPTRALQYATLSAERRIGLSGTPLDRQDSANAMVIGLLGPVVYKVGTKELADAGYLAKGRVIPVSYKHRRHSSSSDYVTHYEAEDDEEIAAAIIAGYGIYTSL